MSQNKGVEVGFGLADITIDGKDMGLQAEAAVFSAEPEYIEVETYEAGIFDYYLDKWNVHMKVSFQQDGFEQLKLALPATVELKENGETVGLTDGRLHQRMRDKAVEIRVHPREAAEDDKSMDVVIFKAVPVGVFERTYGKEAVQYEIEFHALPLTGKSGKNGEYFRIGLEGDEEEGTQGAQSQGTEEDYSI